MAATGGLMTRDDTLEGLKAAFLRFCAWERDEALRALPPAALAWLMGRGAREAVVQAGASDLVVAGEAGAEGVLISGAEIKAASLDAALTRRGLSRKAIAIVLELPPTAFLTRQFEAPTAALGQLPLILNAEIDRKTPFRRDEILVGHRVAPHGANGKARVAMALLRRDLVAPALEACGLGIGDLAAIRAQSVPEGLTLAPTIAVGAGAGVDRSFQRAALALALLGLFLTLAGLGATAWRQSREGADLDARIAQMSSRAAGVRQIAERASKESRLLAILRETRQKNGSLTALWEEISRLTPDSAFLTDFHLSESKSGERSVDLAGFAQSAVGLPLLFDQSKYFSDATLTAPITSDAKEKRESFSLRLKTRPQGGAQGENGAPDRPAKDEGRR